jgi:hypothetical protein
MHRRKTYTCVDGPYEMSERLSDGIGVAVPDSALDEHIDTELDAWRLDRPDLACYSAGSSP